MHHGLDKDSKLLQRLSRQKLKTLLTAKNLLIRARTLKLNFNTEYLF